MPRQGDRSAGQSRLYVGRLSSRIRSRDLEDLFCRYGRIRDVDMKQDFAFVEFNDSRDADEARYKLDNREFMGSRIVVEFARMGPRGGGGGGGGGGSRDRDHSRRGGLEPGTGRCYNCGKDGHWARDCKAGDWRDKCYRCGRSGHIERSCRYTPRPEYRKEHGSRSPRSRSRSVSRSRSRSPRRRSPSRGRSYSRSRSRSPPYAKGRKNSRSASGERKRSQSPRSASRGRSPSPNNRRKQDLSRSRSPPVKPDRSLSRSPPVKQDRSRSRSPPVKQDRSRSRSPPVKHPRDSRSRSPVKGEARQKSGSPMDKSPVPESPVKNGHKDSRDPSPEDQDYASPARDSPNGSASPPARDDNDE